MAALPSVCTLVGKETHAKEYDYGISATNLTSKGVLALDLPVRRLEGLIRKPGEPISIEEDEYRDLETWACAGCPKK